MKTDREVHGAIRQIELDSFTLENSISEELDLTYEDVEKYRGKQKELFYLKNALEWIYSDSENIQSSYSFESKGLTTDRLGALSNSEALVS